MEGKEREKNWSEKVEDLIQSGEIDSAISLLETLISHFDSQFSPNSGSQLSSALFELSKLYSSKGLSVKSDQLSSRALAIKLRPLSSTEIAGEEGVSRVLESCGLHNGSSSSSTDNKSRNADCDEIDTKPLNHNVAPLESSDDDWEAMVDRAPDELLYVSPKIPPEPELSKLSLSDMKSKGPIRRGRGTFTYKKQGLHSDEQADDYDGNFSLDEAVVDKGDNASEAKTSVYGTRHVIVLDGFNPKIKTADLEKLFEDFRDRDFTIRWINDTVALAVFRTPSIAREALDSVRCSFSTRVMEEDDSLLGSVSAKDLEPPRQRPKTSARTAQRLIAQELGLKLPSNFGSRELKKQEDARKNRIITRQNLRDEAWGPDDTKMKTR